MVGKAEDVAILCLDICAVCLSGRVTLPADLYPPAGDEVGGDDFTLGETMSRGTRRCGRVAPHGPPWLAPLPGKFSLLCPSTWLHSLLLAETLARWQIVPEAS